MLILLEELLALPLVVLVVFAIKASEKLDLLPAISMALTVYV